MSLGVTEAQLKHMFLLQRQSLPLGVKIQMLLRRIKVYYEMNDGNVHVSLSGGADSTVLLSFVRYLYPDVPAVFVDTGVEFPEIREFVRTVDNVLWLRPERTFKQVCLEYGYPVVSKETSQKIHEARNTRSEFLRTLRTSGVVGRERQSIPKKWQYLLDAPFKISHKCCDILKKRPLYAYEKRTGSKPFVGVMASESVRRTQTISEHGCFVEGAHPMCRPMSYWTSADSHACLKFLPHSRIYDMGYARTGCMFCMFGVHLNTPNKFQVLKQTHPRLHAKALPALGINRVLDYLNVPYN